ncbi:hypothetical protein HHI36_006763 [Cryptolaemus montrouzieri]|uniref:SHSP domain-containing protein n=1 Tax=Cryptolaemus montrouzieri TaxID=559131 RepID=A0ABD2NY16_9CUCU
MSLLPYILDSYSRPSRIMDQHFGLTLDPETLFCPVSNQRYSLGNPLEYIRPWSSALSRRDVGSTLSVDGDKFQANLDVQQFKPEEITVKATGNNTITIEGKHEEKQDDHGFISRHFVRKYVIPKYCDYTKVESKLSSDGVLSITAPRIQDDKSVEHKSIPIQKTGQPAKIENKKPKNEEPKK